MYRVVPSRPPIWESMVFPEDSRSTRASLSAEIVASVDGR